MEFPAWLAVMEQFPSLTGVRVEPEIVQIAGVVLAKLMLNPLVVVADNAVAPAPGEMETGGAKVIVCAVFTLSVICPVNVNLPTLAKRE